MCELKFKEPGQAKSVLCGIAAAVAKRIVTAAP